MFNQQFLFLDGSILIDPKTLQNFVFWWFYVTFGVVCNILKVGQNRRIGKCRILKLILSICKSFFIKNVKCKMHNSVNFHDKSLKLAVFPHFQGQSFILESVMLSHLLYYIWGTPTPSPSLHPPRFTNGQMFENQGITGKTIR